MGENDAYEEFLSKHLQQNDDRPPIQVCNPNYARNHYLVATTRNRMTHAMKGEVGYISIMDFVAGFADMVGTVWCYVIIVSSFGYLTGPPPLV